MIIFENADQLAEAIQAWEYDAGESFTDYYMHDMVNNKEWAQFLIENGHIERGNYILEHPDVNGCMCQQELYEVCSTEFKFDATYGAYVDTIESEEDLYFKDIQLWAKFLFNDEWHINDLQSNFFNCK